MSKNHAQAGDYAGAMEARGTPKTCAYRHRIPDWGACRGKVLERDHVDELQDAPWQDPKTAWLVFACDHHHTCKTNEKRAQRKARKEGRMTDTAPRLPKASGKAAGGKGTGGKATAVRVPVSRRRRVTGWAVRGVALLVVAAIWLNLTDPIIAAVRDWWLRALTLVLLAVCAYVSWRVRARRARLRDEERADWLLAKVSGIARKMQCAPDAVRIEPRGRGAWTRGGLCVRGRVTYPDHVLDDDPKLRKAVEDHWRHKLGMRVDQLAIEWNVGLNRFDFWPTPVRLAEMEPDETGEPAPPEPTDARQVAEDKLAHVMESVRKRAPKGDWTGTLLRHDSEGPLEVEIVWPPDFDAASDEQRVKLMETINMGLHGRWRADSWDGERRKLHVTRRPKLDRFIANPGHSERVSWHLIPLGRDESGSTVVFDALSIPHALIVGATRRGKSVCLRTIIFAVLNPPKGTPLIDVPAAVLLDPKEIEFAGYAGMPGVVEVATEDKQMADAVDRVFYEQKRRYRWKKQKGIPLSRHRPIYLVIDEYQEFVEALNDAWVAQKGTTGKEHPSVAKTRRIARLGAAARIFLILATQRPDLDWFKGVLRENIQYRLAFGKLSPEASKMAFSRQDIGRDIPDSLDGQLLRGRGNCSVGDEGRPREFQAYWTPNPDPDEEPNALDRSLLAMLIPKQRDGLEEPMWDLDRLLAEFADDDEDEDDEEAGSGTSSSRYRGNGRGRAQTTPKPRPRSQQAPKPRQENPRPKPEGFRALRLAITCGTPRWVMVDGERLCAVEVEPDESAADYWLVTFKDESGKRRDSVAYPDDGTLFDLAEQQ